MAYVYPLNPAVPADGDPASQGDDQLRLIKNVIIERLSTIVEDIDDDPLVLKPSVFPVEFAGGTLAARPNPPASANLLYYAFDTDQLFVSQSDGGASFEWVEAKAAEEADTAVLAISAGEARFAPLGTETRATKVKNAINTAKLSSAAVKVVYVPKSLWGYVADLDYDSSMYDSTVLLVREGSMVSWYDPVAYGADNSGTTNSRIPINTCYEHADVTAQGIRMVAFTVPGTYLMNTDVDQLGVPLFFGEGCALSGAGDLTGTRPFRIPPDPAEPIDAAFVYDPQAGGNKATAVTVVKRLSLRVEGDTDAAGTIEVDFNDPGFAGAYDLDNLITAVATFRNQVDQDQEETPLTVDTVNNKIILDLSVGGAGVTAVVWDLYMTFSA